MATNMTEFMALLRDQNRASSSYTQPPENRQIVDPNPAVPPTFVSESKEVSFSATTHVPAVYPITDPLSPPPAPTAVPLPPIAFLSVDSAVHTRLPLAMLVQPPAYTVLPPTVPPMMSVLALAHTVGPFHFQASQPYMGFSYRALPPLNISPLEPGKPTQAAPGMWLPLKIKILDFKRCDGTRDPRHHLHDNNHVIGRIMIYDASALNLCPISTLKQMNVDMSRIRASTTTVRAFDGSKREVNGEIDLLIDNDYVLRTGLGARAQGILRPVEVEEYWNRRGLGFRPSYHAIVQARRGKHLHRLATHYEKLSRGIPVPQLSQFFLTLPQVIGSTSDCPSTESDDSSSNAIEVFLALPAIYVVTEETSSRVHIRLTWEDDELTNWTLVPRYSAMVVDV
ncbi:hypothetical protein CRG98_013306 [Punica granatum]|uniref:Uncharacterized protein n=1 Tax=Punica granatum TaxID=22663 RepID=A0A2I0KCT2_PUNGR|nr:hypothetical protein CRG98_013306 [Punica granatum]